MHAHLDTAKIQAFGSRFFLKYFSTRQCYLFAYKLFKMKISVPSILWRTDYLANRTTVVRIGAGVKSEARCTNIGAPFLFSSYAADCRNQHENTPIVKSADATGLTGLMTRDDDSHYRQQISDFVDWCDENYLQLDVASKQLVVFRPFNHYVYIKAIRLGKDK